MKISEINELKGQLQEALDNQEDTVIRVEHAGYCLGFMLLIDVYEYKGDNLRILAQGRQLGKRHIIGMN